MTIINKFFQWLNSYLSGRKESSDIGNKQKFIPPLKFDSITEVNRPPSNKNVKKDTFYLVTDGKNHKWTLFQCPCGCEHVITLSLQSTHNPHWRFTMNTAGQPTLYPSIWQDTSCFSHFWLKEGRIYWCPDSGASPWQATNKVIK